MRAAAARRAVVSLAPLRSAWVLVWVSGVGVGVGRGCRGWCWCRRRRRREDTGHDADRMCARVGEPEVTVGPHREERRAGIAYVGGGIGVNGELLDRAVGRDLADGAAVG